MEIYFYLIILLFSLSLIEIIQNNTRLYQKNKSIYLFIIYTFTVILVGLRWQTGTDWLPYLEIFNHSSSLKNSLSYSVIIEPGYIFLNWLSYNIYPNYSCFLLIHSLLFYYFIIYGLNRITKYPITTFLFIFCSTLGILGSNRQLLALSLIFYFLTWAIEKKKSFFIIVLGAMQFHTTALLGGAFYFINRRFKNIHILTVLIIAFIIGMTGLPGKMFALIGGGFGESGQIKTEAYISTVAEEKLSLIGVIRRIIYLLFFVMVRNKIEKNFQYYNFLLNGYIISAIIYLLFSNSLIILVNRGSLYFSILEGILFTSVFYILRKSDTKLFYLVFLVFLSILSMYQSISAYPELFDPYKGVWYNINFYRNTY